jgi:hypothetical protein
MPYIINDGIEDEQVTLAQDISEKLLFRY